MAKNDFYTIRAESGDSAEVYLYGVIGSSFDGATANEILAEIKPAINGIKKINIHVASPGGDMFEGVKLRSFFMNHPAEKVVFLDGSVASAATLAIAMPGVRTVMARGSEYLIHNPWAVRTFAGEGADWENVIPEEARSTGIRLNKSRGQMLDIYEERSTLDRDVLSEMVNAETALTPSEAVDAGFADEIGSQQAIAAFCPPEMMAHWKRAYKGFKPDVKMPTCQNAPIEAKSEPLETLPIKKHQSVSMAIKARVSQAKARTGAIRRQHDIA